MIFDVVGFPLLVGLLAFGAWALWKPLRALWVLTSRRPPSEAIKDGAFKAQIIKDARRGMGNSNKHNQMSCNACISGVKLK